MAPRARLTPVLQGQHQHARQGIDRLRPGLGGDLLQRAAALDLLFELGRAGVHA
jgi:hypothetical protein